MTYLALGDSYTIGEGVPLQESFPYQVVQLLRRDGFMFHAPEIVAKTGWTTDELQSALSATRLLPSYDLLSLLVGVNNQYRGRSLDEYKQQFESLLKKSIRLAGNNPARVIVLSIPDWGITPFASDRDQQKISKEINEFNLANLALTRQHQAQYVHAARSFQEAGDDPSLLTTDMLHPSGKEYGKWAIQLVQVIRHELNKV